MRKICGVQHSYWSRITNAEVLSYVHAPKLSQLLFEQQLLVFGKMYRRPPHDVLREAIFKEESDVLQLYDKKRRKGRPKLAWAVEVRKMAITICGNDLGSILADEQQWKKCVRKYCRAPCSSSPAA